MVNTRAADRAYLDVNDAFLQLTGYTRQELLGRPSTDLNLWADPDQRQHLLQLFSTQDRLVDAEFAFRQKSGALRIGLMSAEHIELNDEACVLTSMRDITESKQAEEALRQYTQRLEILRMIDQAILSEGSPIASTPEAIAHATLSNLQRLLPCPFSGVFSFDFPSRHTNMLAAIGPGADLLEDCISMQEYFLSEDLREVLVVEKQDLEKLNPNGDLERILTSYDIQTLLNIPLVAQGELIGALLLTSDAPAYFQPDRIEVASEVAAMLAVAIQQARLHQQVQRQTEDLEERVQQRTAEMEAKNRELETFTYSVSHDLKAPLRGVDGYSRLLMEGYANLLDEEGRTFLLRIREGVVRMGQLIEDLLAYSKLEQRSLHKSQVYLPVIIENLLAERRSEIQESKIVVTTNISCHFVYAEVEGLSQALRNLFDNAIKFTRDAPQPHIEIGGRVTSNSCILWVKDNGIGFDMQYQSRIFEIFQRLNRMEEYPGTGVGLAIVRKAMQRMGGRVWAESSPGAGATFYLEMPEG
jgi:PAS domain S-box-containing protein